MVWPCLCILCVRVRWVSKMDKGLNQKGCCEGSGSRVMWLGCYEGGCVLVHNLTSKALLLNVSVCHDYQGGIICEWAGAM